MFASLAYVFELMLAPRRLFLEQSAKTLVAQLVK
jgi:hypothetical protein